MGLATSSDTARSVKDTKGRFWLHRVSSACLWLEQRFFLEMPKLAPLLCSGMLKPNSLSGVSAEPVSIDI